jgi:hypothetical protein
MSIFNSVRFIGLSISFQAPLVECRWFPTEFEGGRRGSFA